MTYTNVYAKFFHFFCFCRAFALKLVTFAMILVYVILFAILLLAIHSTEIWVIAFVKYIVYFLIFKAEVFQHAT